MAKDAGTSTGYALDSLQGNGTMFIAPGAEVYEGMVIGQRSRDGDLVVNPCRQKAMSNMRSKAADDAIVLTPPRELTLEQAIEFIESDELVEVTPKNLRLRKTILVRSSRKRAEKKEDQAE